MSLLEVNDINVYYGAIHAIKGISFSVDEGEVVTLIGANGAGKSTTLNTVAGFYPRPGAASPYAARQMPPSTRRIWRSTAWRSAPKGGASSSR